MQLEYDCYKTVCIAYIKRTELRIYTNWNKTGYVSIKMLHDSIMLVLLYFLYFLSKGHIYFIIKNEKLKTLQVRKSFQRMHV